WGIWARSRPRRPCSMSVASGRSEQQHAETECRVPADSARQQAGERAWIGDGQRATKHGFAGLDGGAASSTMRGTIGAQPLVANHSHLRDVGRASHPGDEPVAVDGFAVNRRAVRLFAGGEKGIYLSRTRPPGILTRGSRLANAAAKPDKRAYTDLEAIMSSGTPVVGHLPARRRIRKDPGEP